MDKMTGETSPTVHLHQQIGNFDVGQHSVKRVSQRVGFFRNTILKWADLEASTAQFHTRHLSTAGERIGLVKRLQQQWKPLLQISCGRCRNGDTKAVLGHLLRKVRARYQVVLEV